MLKAKNELDTVLIRTEKPCTSTVTIHLHFNTLLVILLKELVEQLVVVVVLVLSLIWSRDTTPEKILQLERQTLLLKDLEQVSDKY